MFELNDSIIDAIVFAMEDQEGCRLIDSESGSVLMASETGGADARLVSPPTWSSREGYRLMENFVRTVRNPGARHELSTALNRGRGVFKAFKEALAASPELEKAFHDHKFRAMKTVIRSWYDDLREIRGLERLGPEPDELEDLIIDDFGIEIGGPERCAAQIAQLALAAQDEALEVLPEVLALREAEIVGAFLGSQDWRGAWIEDGENGAIAAAAARLEGTVARSFGRVFFVYVMPEFRRAGMGTSLVKALEQSFRREGMELLVLDSGYLPREFGEALEGEGLKAYGARGYFRSP